MCIFLGIQGECVKDCCSHGPLGGITSKWTCPQFSNSWQVSEIPFDFHICITEIGIQLLSFVLQSTK